MNLLLRSVVFILVFFCFIKADDIQPYCMLEPASSLNQGIVKPTIPSQFSVHSEMIDINGNSTTGVTEYYDGPGNRAAVFISANDGKSRRFYRFDQQLFLEVSQEIGLCIAIPISEGDHLMGFKQKNGTRRILSPSAALRFSSPGQIENYMGKANIRGIVTDHWQSCLSLQDPQADLEINWYFSSPDEWSTASQTNQVPVRLHMKGLTYDQPKKPQNINHIIEYYEYRPQLPKDTTVFDTPRGMICNSGINPIPTPKLPDRMSFRLEHVDTNDDSVTYSDEVYDFISRITKHVYKSPEFFTYNLNPLTVINDFNTGIAYNIDATLGNCTIRPINNLPTDVKQVDSRHVRMTNPEEFFQLKNHFYQGVRKTRDIECDVWIGKKLDKFNSTYRTEWYFARPDIVGGKKTTTATLVHYAEYRENEFLASFYSNLFDFTHDEPDILQFDISRCYINRGREKFELFFEKKFEFHITSSLHKFKVNLIMSVALALSVSPLRIQNLDVEPIMDGFIVSFELLDAAPLFGDVKNPITEKSLSLASTQLHKILNDKTLDVYVQSYDQMITINPGEFTYGIKQSIKPATTYSGGSMFALALAMTIIGMVLSAGITFKIKAP